MQTKHVALTGVGIGVIAVAVLAGAGRLQERDGLLMPFEVFQSLHAKGAVLVMDVRDPESFRHGRIPGAMNIPLGEAKARASEIRQAVKGRQIVTYCSCPSEATSARAARTLVEMGYKDAKALVGGYVKWVETGGRIEK